MSTIVSKSLQEAVVVPSEQGTATGTGGIINLSSFDKCFAPIPVPMLLVFDQPIEDPVESIKRAVSRALVHYHPMAGRVVAGADGELTHISCTGEGVFFVGASASCALDQVPLLDQMDLAVRYPTEYCRPCDPLVLMQVTQFACGGFVVGVTWNHVAADGAGMAQFLQAVGEITRGMPAPSVVPVRSEVDGSIPCVPPAVVAALRSQMRVGGTEERASLDVTVPWRLIGRIKAECGGECTTFDAVAAVLWQCRTRAVIDKEDTGSAPLFFTSNVRGLVGAKRGYYGNCVMAAQVLHVKSGAVASGDARDLVKLIRLAKEKIPDMLLSLSGGGAIDGGKEEVAYNKYETLVVTSWRNLGLEAVDFGRGGPARVMQPQCERQRTALNLCVLFPPSPSPSPCTAMGMDGVNVLALCVKPEHAHAFLRELDNLAAALNPPPC